MKDEFLDDAEAHTLAKHQILQEYLKGWLPILGQGQTNRLLFFDGFAGCGELTKGHPGSPVVAIQTAMKALSGQAPLEIRMVEKDPARCAYLLKIIQRERKATSTLYPSIRVFDPICGECEPAVTQLLDDHARSRKPLGPALFFLDQYGYSNIPMALLQRILSNSKCETFSYLNWQRMHPYFTDPTKADTFTRALGGDEWRDVQALQGQQRIDGFKAIYVRLLRERAKAKFVYDFAMRGRDHRPIYWLFFCTNSIKGLEVMKKAMWKVDPTGRFEFSDRDAEQGMLTGYTQEMLADDLHRDLCGQTLSSDGLKEYVLTKTPEYTFKEAIEVLKSRGCAKEQRRADQTIYVFTDPPMKTMSMFAD